MSDSAWREVDPAGWERVMRELQAGKSATEVLADVPGSLGRSAYSVLQGHRAKHEDRPGDAADRKIADLEAEVKRLKRKCNNTIDHLNRSQDLAEERLAELQRLRLTVTRLHYHNRSTNDLPDIHKLIQLCHPDRHHENLQELANAVTKKLLELRRRNG